MSGKLSTAPTAGGLREAVYAIVAQIPRGRVLTYGEIARLAGYPNHSRLVGRIMRDAPDGQLPCHRVVSASGRLAPHYPAQCLFEDIPLVSVKYLERAPGGGSLC